MARKLYCQYCRTYTPCFKCELQGIASATNKKLQKYSLTRFLESGELADVEIVVESDHFPDRSLSIKVHRMILALHNEVFRAMFYGDFAKEERVLIIDLHPEGVLGLIRYFYSGQLQVESTLQAVYTRTAAIKYLEPKLAEECLDYAIDNMSEADVCATIDYLHIMGEEDNDILAQAIDLLDEECIEVLTSDSLKSCLEETVHLIIDKATNVPEVSILEAVFSWAQEQCLRRAEDGEDTNLRKIMEPFFPKLRFLAITPKEFASVPNKWGILKDDEALALLCNIANKGSMPLPDGFCSIDAPR
uniref:BTB domain-containing protein n=1 Tax=Amblyomma triste TaxID=251400 RepID=A0A023GBL9_AMBTT